MHGPGQVRSPEVRVGGDGRVQFHQGPVRLALGMVHRRAPKVGRVVFGVNGQGVVVIGQRGPIVAGRGMGGTSPAPRFQVIRFLRNGAVELGYGQLKATAGDICESPFDAGLGQIGVTGKIGQCSHDNHLLKPSRQPGAR